MSFLQGNTYLKPIHIVDKDGVVVKGDKVVKGEFIFGDIVKNYGEGGEVFWSEEDGAFIVPLTEEETFSLTSGMVEYQGRVLINDGSVCGSLIQKDWVYLVKSTTRLSEGGAGEESGKILTITLTEPVVIRNYEDLNNLPSINGVKLVGNKTTEDLGIVSKESDPTVPQFVKDITEQDIESWNNKASKDYVDNKVAELVNSAPEMLDTLGELAGAVKENQDLIDALKVPTKTSELTNDSGFITADDIPQQEVDLTNYYTKAETQEYVQNYVDSLVGDINSALESVLGV